MKSLILFNFKLTQEYNMDIQSLTSVDLQNEAKYNSFIVCRTKSIPLSQKFPFIVTTLKGKIRPQIQNQEPYQQFQFNFSFDCVNYMINGKSVILGEGNWLRPLLTSKELSLLESYEIINYDPLQFNTYLKFYFYNQKNNSFLQIHPKYLILGDCIVFEDLQHLEQAEFKNICLSKTQKLVKFSVTQKKLFLNEYYSFRCEYGIMSDIHFMGSLVRGLKSIGSYVKKKDSNEYFHFIDEIILRNLKRLYPFSNL